MIPKKEHPWRGIYAAIVTPMTPDFAVDYATLAEHARQVTSVDGIVGLLINGHAGENFVLTREEKKRVTETIVAAVGAHSIIVSGVNAESSLEAAEHARDAEAAGADAILVFGPNAWGMGQDEEMAVTHHRYVIEATKCPIMLFQASVNAGKMAYSEAIFARLLAMPRVVAVKEGSWEVAAYERSVLTGARVAPHVEIMGSGDEHLMTSYVVGSTGSLVSLAILQPAEIVALDRAVSRDDMKQARRLHALIQPLAKAIYGTPPGNWATARLKACLKLMGLIPCDATRPPIGPLPAAEIERLRQALRTAGLLKD